MLRIMGSSLRLSGLEGQKHTGMCIAYTDPTRVFYKERDFRQLCSFTIKSPFDSSEKYMSLLKRTLAIAATWCCLWILRDC